MINGLSLFMAALAAAWAPFAYAADGSLTLEEKISLGPVVGRIDRLAIDLKRQRVFVAELGANTVAVVDLRTKKVLKQITGIAEPQGVAYVGATDRLFVANAGDGTVRMFAGEQLNPSGKIRLGDDANNIHVDGQNRVFVGYGNGAIAVLDGATGRKIADFPLSAHPEAFEVGSDGKRLFVNEPGAGRIGVIDTETGKEL